MRHLLLLCLLALCLALPATAGANGLVLRGVGSPPLSDAAAAALVDRSTWEPRPDNASANGREPTQGELNDFRNRSDMPNKGWVTGHFHGTTDEITQWAAYKWGFSPNLLRAVAAVESWWHMSTVGDGGDSFGLMQIRRPYHCCYPLTADSTAFNADYYGAILRAYYDGEEGFLNQVEHGQTYRAGDLWGSIGVWASGRWHLGSSDSYVAQVRDDLRHRVWFDRWF